jgi:hypothetical protein
MSELEWDDRGWGFLPPDGPCMKDYWTDYQLLDATPMGRVLTALRAGFVNGHVTLTDDGLVDVGIGGGAFCEYMDCLGIDIDTQALEWLGVLRWEGQPVDVMTFWDSLEHIADPADYLDKVRNMVFVSTPIYLDQSDALTSKHYKPNEHLWYFTHDGLLAFMDMHGLTCIAHNGLEIDAGREGIRSYAFERFGHFEP